MEEVRHALQAFVGNILWLLPDMDTGILQLSPAPTTTGICGAAAGGTYSSREIESGRASWTCLPSGAI